MTELEIDEIRNEIGCWPNKPLISIVMPVYNTRKEDLIEAIASVKSQYYENWELCIADDCSTKLYIRDILESTITDDARIKVVFRESNGHICEASNSAIEIATGMYVALMDHDDILPRHALYYVAKEILNHPDVDLIYSDEDKIRADGSLGGPHFKPDWNEELFLTQNYINHLGVFRTSLIREIGGFRNGFEGSQDHDLVLRFLERTDESRIRHIPKILYHWRSFSGSGTFSDQALEQAINARQRAVRDYLKTQYPKVQASVVRGPFGCNRIVRELPAPAPHVTIVIPTRDRLDLLEKCVTSVFDKTIYPSFDVIIVDNDSEKNETFTYLDNISNKYPVDVMRYSGRFNYSAMNNRAVEKATGEVVVLLNNDIKIISSEWLREMVIYAIQPNIGAVGAKLLYENGAVQHAGIILGSGGIANHAFHGYPGKDSGYQARLQLPQYISAVTGACLAVAKKKYQLVGGLDETELPVSYNDVDLCLKLSSNGFNNIYTPYACLIHYESVSRGPDTTPEKSERLKRESEVMKRRWGSVLKNDKYYNPNFSKIDSCFRFLVQ
ncbi:glycosyltransferase [bacterium]|nr:glycosyltransferase [bacterium]